MNPAYQFMLIAWAVVLGWIAVVILTNRKVHPKALFALFMVELWERFSYYGMRALLVLYMTAEVIKGAKSGFGFADEKAFGIYAAYGALVYLTPIIGGFFADRMMGFRNAILWGAALMAAGQFTLFMDNETMFYIGLALLVVGNGFFKPNISSMIGKFYKKGDPRRDGAFTIFYMGINIGAFLTPLTCGAIGEIEGWKYGFLTAGVGMLVGLGIFYWAQNSGWLTTNVDEEGNEMPNDRPIGLVPEERMSMAGIDGKWLPYIFTLVLVGVSWLLIRNDAVVDWLLGIVGAGIIVYMITLSGKYEKQQQQRIWVILLLLFFTTIFWTFFELAGSALNLFTERNVNRSLFGFTIPTSFFQSVNPLFIMAFAPLFSFIWIKLAESGREPSAPYKFGIGLVLLGLGFLVLYLGEGTAVAGLVPAIFLVLLYMLHTLGELTLSPVGLSLVTKLAPSQIVGMLMGIWFLSSSIAHQGGKHIAKLTAVDEGKIVASETFKACFADDALESNLARFSETISGTPLETVLVSDEFVAELNKSGQNYSVASITVSGENNETSQVKYLVRGEAGVAATKVFTPVEAESIVTASATGEVVSCLKQDSLKLSINVFQLLGFVAIGCGVLLFLLGPMVSKWMHGIK